MLAIVRLSVVVPEFLSHGGGVIADAAVQATRIELAQK